MASQLTGGVIENSTNITREFMLRKAADSTEQTGKIFSDFTLTYSRTRGAVVTVTTVTLAAITTAWTSGGIKEIDATNAPGVYRVDFPDAMFASGVDSVTYKIKCASCFVFAETIYLDAQPAALVAAKAVIDTINANVSIVITNLAAAKAVIDTTKTNVDTLTTNLAAAKAVIDTTKTNVDTANTAIIAAKAVIDATKVVVDATKVVVDATKVVADATKTVADTIATGVVNANTSLGTANTSLTALTASVSTANANIVTVNSNLVTALANLATANTGITGNTTALTAIKTELDTVATNVVTADTGIATLLTNLATAKTELDAVKAKTDLIPSSPAAVGSNMALDSTQLTAILNRIFGAEVETGVTFEQAIQAIGAVIAGKSSGHGTSELLFKRMGGTETRVTADVNSSGRTTVTFSF